MKTERITFTGALGDTLAARLDRPEGPARAAALLAHCGAAVRFHRAGPFRGEFANTNFSSNVGDLLAAVGWMTAQGIAPQLLIGHSLGGAAVLKVALLSESQRPRTLPMWRIILAASWTRSARRAKPLSAFGAVT